MKRTKTVKKADLILGSDWHIRESVPVCRTDEEFFVDRLFGKIKFVKELAQKHDCPVLHGGDLFHHWKPSPYLLSRTMDVLPEKFYSIYGQHDLPQHSMKEKYRSGIHVLETAGVLKVLAGAHWGDDPKTMEHPSFSVQYGPYDTDYRSVLVWHHMVWQGKRLWPGQTDPSAIAVLKKYKNYDLILTGDNHKAFVEHHEGRILVNSGSLSRQSADQNDFLPRVYLYYANTNTVEPVYIPVANDAVSRAHLERDEERNDRISAFIEKLDGEWQAGMSFEANLKEFFSSNKVRESVKEKVYKAIEL